MALLGRKRFDEATPMRTLSVTIPIDVWEAIHAEAAVRETTVSALVRPVLASAGFPLRKDRIAAKEEEGPPWPEF